MSVTITSSPAALMAIDEPIVWGLAISSLGTPGVDSRSIAYQLQESGGGAIIAESEIAPVAAAFDHRLNFVRDIKSQLTTAIPALYSGTVQDAGGVKKVVLKYGETVLNLLTGVATGFPPGSTSAEVTVVNSANNNFVDLPDPMPANKLLTWKPFQNYFNDKAFDWLYVFGAATVTIIKDFTFTGGAYTGTTVATLTALGAGKVSCIPIGYQHHPGLAGVSSYVVKLTLYDTPMYFLFTCAPKPEKDIPSQVVYFDASGGYTALDGELEQISASAQKTQVSTYKDARSVVAGGDTLMDSKGYVSYIFRRRMPQARDEYEQMMRFVAAENYYIPLQTLWANGLVKFISTDESRITISSGEYIQLTLRSAHPIISANGRN